MQDAFESEQNSKEDTQLDVSKLSEEQIQAGINANLQAMIETFVGRLTMLEQIVGRKVDVKFNATLTDGRKFHVRCTERK